MERDPTSLERLVERHVHQPRPNGVVTMVHHPLLLQLVQNRSDSIIVLDVKVQRKSRRIPNADVVAVAKLLRRLVTILERAHRLKCHVNKGVCHVQIQHARGIDLNAGQRQLHSLLAVLRCRQLLNDTIARFLLHFRRHRPRLQNGLPYRQRSIVVIGGDRKRGFGSREVWLHIERKGQIG